MTDHQCPFCAIVAGEAPAAIVHRWTGVLAFEPLNPVTPGHVLVVPHCHVADVTEDPITTAQTMRCAAELIRSWDHAANLITSVGEAATQSVFHLHVHVVPRYFGDGLPLPWTSQQAAHGDTRGGHVMGDELDDDSRTMYGTASLFPRRSR